MKLTKPQRALMSRTRYQSKSGDGQFILCHDTTDDRVAKNLCAKGLGGFADGRSQYSWRKRSGYFNNLWLNEKGIELADSLGSKIEECP